MLEFSNTQDDPIEIKEDEEEVSVHREEILFTEDDLKSKVVQQPLREVIPSMIFQNMKMAIFQLVWAPLGKRLQVFYFQFLW